MNKVYFCYHHTKSKMNLYGIYDTTYDLPETIPMDIATFLKFHIETGRPIIQFIKIYLASEIFNRKTKQNGGFFSPEKKMISSLIKASKLNFTSDETINFINEIEQIITKKDYSLDQIVKLLEQKLRNFVLVKKPSYFLSYAHSVKCFKETSDPLKYYRIFYSEKGIKDNEDIILQFFISYKIPASAIPHILRNKKSFKEILIFRNMQHMLPVVSHQELQQKTTFTYFEKEFDINDLRDFYRILLRTNYGYAKKLHVFLEQENTTIEEINIQDLTTFWKSENRSLKVYKLCNFRSNTGELLLPGVFFKSEFQGNKKYIILDKFGFQNLFIFSRKGDFIMMNANCEVWLSEGNSLLHIDWDRNETEYNIKDNEAYPVEQPIIDIYYKPEESRPIDMQGQQPPESIDDDELPF